MDISAPWGHCWGLTVCTARESIGSSGLLAPYGSLFPEANLYLGLCYTNITVQSTLSNSNSCNVNSSKIFRSLENLRTINLNSIIRISTIRTFCNSKVLRSAREFELDRVQCVCIQIRTHSLAESSHAICYCAS